MLFAWLPSEDFTAAGASRARHSGTTSVRSCNASECWINTPVLCVCSIKRTYFQVFHSLLISLVVPGLDASRIVSFFCMCQTTPVPNHERSCHSFQFPDFLYPAPSCPVVSFAVVLHSVTQGCKTQQIEWNRIE